MVGYWWLFGVATLVCAYSFVHDIVTIPTLKGSITLAGLVICQLAAALTVSFLKQLTECILRYRFRDPTAVPYIVGLDLSDRIFDVIWILIVNLFWFCLTHMRIDDQLTGPYSLLKEFTELHHPFLISTLIQLQFLLVLRALGSKLALWLIKIGLATRLSGDLIDYLNDLNALCHFTAIGVQSLNENARNYHKEVLTRLDVLSARAHWGAGCYSTSLWIQQNFIQLNASDGTGLTLYDRADCQNFASERFREIAQVFDSGPSSPSTISGDSVCAEIAELPPDLQNIIRSELKLFSLKAE